MTNQGGMTLTEEDRFSSAVPDVGPGHFDLDFLRHGSRTVIGRQFVSYPFHLTRPFMLDRAIPSLLTVYQQSSSGGIYRADRLASRYQLGPGTAVHVTTQAATIVHDCHGERASHMVDIALREGAFLALMPDPTVLFPGASSSTRLEARLAPGAVLLVSDAFAVHDPEGASRPFDQLVSDTIIRGSEGRLLVRDSIRVTGDALVGQASPMGGKRIAASFLVAGAFERLPPVEALVGLQLDDRAVVGVTALPNEGGWGVRCLATDAIAARRVSEQLFSICVRAALGAAPTPRRK